MGALGVSSVGWPGQQPQADPIAGACPPILDHCPQLRTGAPAVGGCDGSLCRMPLPTALYDLAEEQLGLVSRGQLIGAVGLPRARVAMESVALRRVTRGVYAFRGAPVHRHAVAVAAGLRWGRRGVVTGAAALELSGPPGLHLGGEVDPLLALAPGVRVQAPGVPVIVDRAPGRRVAMLGDVRVAVPLDALIDLIAQPGRVRPRALRLAFDQLRWAGLIRAGDVAERSQVLGVWSAISGHELARHDQTASTGWGERRLESLAARFEPAPEAQYWVTPHRRVDLYFPTVRLAIEYQGSVDHDSPTGRAADRSRDQELSAAGIRILYLAAADLREDTAAIAAIAAALTTRAHQLGLAAPRLTGR